MRGFNFKFSHLFALSAMVLMHVKPSMETSDDPLMAYDFLYNEGVESYLSEKWEDCINNFEMALEDWHWWKKNTIQCRRKCAKNDDTAEDLFSALLSEEDKVFEKMVRSTLCLVKCKKEAFGSRMDRVAESHVDDDFDMKKPYDYLQLCYFKMGKLKEAADAAATVLAEQPEHEIMKNNLKYYLTEGEIVAETVLNRELKEYGKHYIMGNSAYNNNDYAETIVQMEKSLELYYGAEDDCRRLCESPFDQGWFPDFVSSVANHYTFTLRCKRRCAWNLSNLYGEYIENFYGSYFNYLQYSYYQGGEFDKAYEAVASALWINPGDDAQLRNKQYYMKTNDISEDKFVPREAVVKYLQRLDYEEKMMDFIETSFIFLNDNGILEDVDDDDVESSKTPSKDKVKLVKAKQLTEWALAARRNASCEGDQFTNVSQMGIQVAMTGRELGGRNRVVADGFATQLECLVMEELTKLASVENSGYKGAAPHTPAETFQGVTLGRTGLLVHAKLIGEEVLNLILDVTDHCRGYLQKYFKLKKQLYFSFTHLVCRTAKPEESESRLASDLSHEVHVDNCILQESGACLRIPPAYTFRDYSAILYLNDEFEGGEFIFTQDRTGASYEGIVQPTCGRMVGFSAGPENPHGVLPVLEGSRCAIGMWFTHNKHHNEIERSLAEMLLKRKREE